MDDVAHPGALFSEAGMDHQMGRRLVSDAICHEVLSRADMMLMWVPLQPPWLSATSSVFKYVTQLQHFLKTMDNKPTTPSPKVFMLEVRLYSEFWGDPQIHATAEVRLANTAMIQFQHPATLDFITQ